MTYSVAGLRDTPIEPEDFAKLEKARRTTDPRNLFALMPVWLRNHVNKSKMPTRPVFDPRVVLPNLCTRHREPWASYKFPNTNNVAKYVREFERSNNLRSPALVVPKSRRASRAKAAP